MKIFRIYLFLCANFVAAFMAYYRECYREFSLCLITNTDDPYYLSKDRLSQSSAEDWCKKKSSSLAIITNETVQYAIEAFTKDSSAKLDSDIITYGSRFDLRSWGWINGHQSAIQPSYNTYRYGYLAVSSYGTFYIYGSPATFKRKFICSYIKHNSLCSDGYHQLGMACYKIRNEVTTWFEARNLCLNETGSELAIFENPIPSLTSEWREGFYWIGLRKESWNWWNGQRFEADVQYSNWDNGNPSSAGSNCLCVKASTGKWTDCECAQKYRYICMQGYSADYASTTTTLTTTLSTLAAVDDSTSQFHSTSTQSMGDNVWGKTSEKSDDTKDHKNLGMLLGLGIGSACLLILIIVIAVVVFMKNRRSRSGDVGPRHENSPPSTMPNDDAPNTVYAVVMPDDNEPVRSPSEKTSNQTVYADLDLEPKRKVAHRTSEPVRNPSEKTPNEVFYEDLDLASKGNTLGRAVPESEYANSSLVDSVYANSAQTKV